MVPPLASAMALLMLLGLPVAARAAQEPPPAESSEPDTPPELSPEELEAIERALSSDTAARAQAPDEEDASPPRNAAGAVVDTLNPELSFIANFALAAFSDEAPLQAGAHDPSERGFNLQQLELALGSSVDPYFRLDGNLVFTRFGVEIEEIYATTLALPWNLQLRAGQFLTRFGRLNATHPHAWHFVDQPLALGKFFGGEANRGVGVEVSWLLPLPWYVEVVASSTDGSGEATARSFWGSQVLDVQGPLDTQLLLAVKQFFPLSSDWSLMLGLSGTTGPNPTGLSNRSDVFGADLFLKWRPVSSGRGERTEVQLQAEWMLRRRQVPGDLLQDHGGYASAVWRFSRRWSVGARGELVTGLEGDPLDPDWDGTRKRWSSELTFRPTEFSRLRLQVSTDRPAWRPPIHAAFLSAEFAIGAHGAHAF